MNQVKRAKRKGLHERKRRKRRAGLRKLEDFKKYRPKKKKIRVSVPRKQHA